MKIKDGFVLREIAGECVVVDVASNLKLDGLIKLNGTAQTLWVALQQEATEDDLVRALRSEYDVDEETARQAALRFVAKLKEMNFLA